jgi:hypothetical protein
MVTTDHGPRSRSLDQPSNDNANDLNDLQCSAGRAGVATAGTISTIYPPGGFHHAATSKKL